MIKHGCPLQGEINSFLVSVDYTSYISTKVMEALKFLLDVDCLHYRNLELGRLHPTCVYQACLCPHWPNQLQLHTRAELTPFQSAIEGP